MELGLGLGLRWFLHLKPNTLRPNTLTLTQHHTPNNPPMPTPTLAQHSNSQIPNTLPPKHPYTRQSTNANPNHDPTPRPINQPHLTTIPAQQPINHQCQPRPRPKAKHLRPYAVTPTPTQQPLTLTPDPGHMQTSCCAVGFRSMALSLWATALSAFSVA